MFDFLYFLRENIYSDKFLNGEYKCLFFRFTHQHIILNIF